MKFYLIAGTLFAIVAGGDYYLGYGEGRNEFVNECITIGNFTAWDCGQDRRRRFICIEAPVDALPEPEAREPVI